MKVLLAILLAAAPVPDAGPLGALPRQELPAQGCAAYLFTTGTERTLVAMAGVQDGRLRLRIDGAITDLARSGSASPGPLGLGGSSSWGSGSTVAVLDLTVDVRSDLSAGAVVSDGTIRLDRAGLDSVVVPVKGLVGCA